VLPRSNQMKTPKHNASTIQIQDHRSASLREGKCALRWMTPRSRASTRRINPLNSVNMSGSLRVFVGLFSGFISTSKGTDTRNAYSDLRSVSPSSCTPVHHNRGTPVGVGRSSAPDREAILPTGQPILRSCRSRRVPETYRPGIPSPDK